MTTVFLNGKFYGGPDDPPITQARVGAFDAGLQHAVGLFETMLGGVSTAQEADAAGAVQETETWVLQLDEHLERLANSARELGLSDQLRTGALGDAIVSTVTRSGLPRARVRLTITGGDLSMLGSSTASGGGGGGGARSVDPTVMIVAQPATQYPAAMFERGVMVSIADGKANALNPSEGHKTLNYWWRLRELQLAAAKGAGEAMVLSVTNHVCSGCVSNVLLVKGDTLYTPIARGQERGEAAGETMIDGVPVAPRAGREQRGGALVLPSPVLPGVTRAWAMRKAEMMGYAVEARMLGVSDLLEAEEVFLSNSSWGVLPVVALEAAQIGDGKPGRLTMDLRDAWLDMLPG